MTYSEIISKVAEELGLSTEIVDKTYKGYWLSIRANIQSLPLKDTDEEGFSILKTNFNIPALGKLCCTKERWLGIKKRYKYINNLKEKSNVKNN